MTTEAGKKSFSYMISQEYVQPYDTEMQLHSYLTICEIQGMCNCYRIFGRQEI